jgi:transposase
MLRRHELSDEEWALLEPLLPPRETGGRPFHEHRLILNGMLYWLHTGVPWRDLPERYGPWQTVYARFRRWSRDGLWDRLLATLQRDLDAAGQIEWTLWCIDGSLVRAHKHAAGAGKKGGPEHPAPQRTRRSRAGAESRRLRHQAAPRH